MKPDDEPMDAPLVGTLSSLTPALLGVFDGMGGEECGEVASFIAAKNAASVKIGQQPLDALSAYCQKANADICKYTEENGISSMGTTAAMLAFDKDGITLCNIGDSKIFRFREGSLEQLSVDHLCIAPFGVKAPLSQNLGISP
jgi:protein phosphatase